MIVNARESPSKVMILIKNQLNSSVPIDVTESGRIAMTDYREHPDQPCIYFELICKLSIYIYEDFQFDCYLITRKF